MKSYISEDALREAEKYDKRHHGNGHAIGPDDMKICASSLAIGRDDAFLNFGGPVIGREWRKTSDIIKMLVDRYGSVFDLSKIHFHREEEYSAHQAICDISSLLIGYDVCNLNVNRKKSDVAVPTEVADTTMDQYLSIKTTWIQTMPKTTWYTFDNVVRWPICIYRTVLYSLYNR